MLQPPAVVRAVCPDCGDIGTTTLHVGVIIDLTSSESSYAIRCPECDGLFTDRLPRDRVIARRLIRGGALYTTI